MKQSKLDRKQLDKLYRLYNKRQLVHPDPLEFLYKYSEALDREVVGIIASSLAYGRVAQILKSVDGILKPMGKHPFRFLQKTDPLRLMNVYKGFKHRFTTDREMVSLLSGVHRVIVKFGSLNRCFVAGLRAEDENVLPALGRFSKELACVSKYLIPSPQDGSACKRLNLFLRWMVRQDDVDPGGWRGVSPAKLIIPLDTHMVNISKKLGITARKTANIRMAEEITTAYKTVNFDDPVKYDFALTRFGIRSDMKISELLTHIF